MFYEINQRYIKMLNNLSLILDKVVTFSEEKKISVEEILNSRLAPDQFSFIKQIQVCSDGAKLGMARITEKTAPKHEDNEKTIEELKTRLQSTITYLESLTEEDFKDVEEKKIVFPFKSDYYLTAKEALLDFGIPNFYFHATTAYAILRSKGMNLGKSDYIGSAPFKPL